MKRNTLPAEGFALAAIIPILGVILLVTPIAYAAGMSWSTFDLERCKPWYFDVGGPHNDFWANSKEREELEVYRRRLLGSPSEPDAWLALLAESTEGSTTAAFADCVWSSRRSAIRCYPYGANPFPLGGATYQYSPNPAGTVPASLKCIKNCNRTGIKVIFDHGWENEGDEPENPEYLAMKKKAMKRCGKVGEAC